MREFPDLVSRHGCLQQLLIEINQVLESLPQAPLAGLLLQTNFFLMSKQLYLILISYSHYLNLDTLTEKAIKSSYFRYVNEYKDSRGLFSPIFIIAFRKFDFYSVHGVLGFWGFGVLVFLVFSMFFSVAPESLLVVSVVFSVSVWGGGKCGLPYSPCCAIAEGHLGCHSIVGGRLPDFCLTAGLRRPPDPMK